MENHSESISRHAGGFEPILETSKQHTYMTLSNLEELLPLQPSGTQIHNQEQRRLKSEDAEHHHSWNEHEVAGYNSSCGATCLVHGTCNEEIARCCHDTSTPHLLLCSAASVSCCRWCFWSSLKLKIIYNKKPTQGVGPQSYITSNFSVAGAHVSSKPLQHTAQLIQYLVSPCKFSQML